MITSCTDHYGKNMMFCAHVEGDKRCAFYRPMARSGKPPSVAYCKNHAPAKEKESHICATAGPYHIFTITYEKKSGDAQYHENDLKCIKIVRGEADEVVDLPDGKDAAGNPKSDRFIEIERKAKEANWPFDEKSHTNESIIQWWIMINPVIEKKKKADAEAAANDAESAEVEQPPAKKQNTGDGAASSRSAAAKPETSSASATPKANDRAWIDISDDEDDEEVVRLPPKLQQLIDQYDATKAQFDKMQYKLPDINKKLVYQKFVLYKANKQS